MCTNLFAMPQTPDLAPPPLPGSDLTLHATERHYVCVCVCVCEAQDNLNHAQTARFNNPTSYGHSSAKPCVCVCVRAHAHSVLLTSVEGF